MEVRYLFAALMLLLALWLVVTQIRSNIRNRVARQAREKLRKRAADRTMVGRLFGGSRVAGQRKQPAQEDSVAPDSSDASDYSDASNVPIDRDSAELKSLRIRLLEKDQTILQLQQVLEELSSTTATRESVNFLQKQLIASRAKVLHQEGELKQLRVEMGLRRPPGTSTSVLPSDKPVMQSLSTQSTQSNEIMKANPADPMRHGETEAEEIQQNSPELRRLRSEFEGNVKPMYATLDEKDDLKLIKGIGPVLEQRLNKIGVTTFRQLAGFNEHDVNRVSTAIAAFPGRIEREDWVGKARELVERRAHPA